MSENEHQQNKLNGDMAWPDGPFSVAINCPDCGEWLWDEDERDFLKTCPACGWQAPHVELPEYLQAALGFMQLVIAQTERYETLTANERQLLCQAVVYATEAG